MEEICLDLQTYRLVPLYWMVDISQPEGTVLIPGAACLKHVSHVLRRLEAPAYWYMFRNRG